MVSVRVPSGTHDRRAVPRRNPRPSGRGGCQERRQQFFDGESVRTLSTIGSSTSILMVLRSHSRLFGKKNQRGSRFLLSSRSRSPRRPVHVSHIPRTTGWQIRRRVGGTACAPQVGRPQLVGATTLPRKGQSQRGAHTAEYQHRQSCLY